MLYSYNGCPVSPNPAEVDVLHDWGVTVDGHKIIYPGGLGMGDDYRVIASYFEEQFYARVEQPLDFSYAVAGMWGYEFRENRNANNLSCHGSNAWDTNAVKHPNGSHNTFTAEQYDEIADICHEAGHTVTVGIPGLTCRQCGALCGWTSASKPDEMHREATRYEPSKWTAVAKNLRPKLGKGSATGKKNPPKPTSPPKADTGSITVPGLTVTELQQQLNAFGANLRPDGVLGPKTTAAIRHFQAQHGLRIDGVVGPKTAAALHKAAGHGAAKYPLKNGQVFGTPLRAGHRSDGTPWKSLTRSGFQQYGDKESIRHCVRAIQAAVGVDQDGRFGDDTEAAVRKWQRAHGLTPDGMVGPATWAKMFA